jgi:hypothetical protein
MSALAIPKEVKVWLDKLTHLEAVRAVLDYYGLEEVRVEAHSLYYRRKKRE